MIHVATKNEHGRRLRKKAPARTLKQKRLNKKLKQAGRTRDGVTHDDR